MGARINIRVGNVELGAELTDTETARAVASALPVESAFSTWGDEFYFEVPVDMGLDETATVELEVGDIGYWPKGNALAIFFGPTPMSGEDGKPVPASSVNLVGRVTGDARVLKKAAGAEKIIIKKA